MTHLTFLIIALFCAVMLVPVCIRGEVKPETQAALEDTASERKHFERQVHPALFARLINCRDNVGVRDLLREGHEVRRPA